jgi:hypothetical protein
MKHFSAIAHNVILLFSEKQVISPSLTSASQNVNAGMPFLP